MRVFFSPEYVVAGAGLETVSKANIVASCVSDVAGLDIVAPDPITEGELLAVHSERYVEDVLNGEGALQCGPRTEETLRSILLTTGGCRDAVHAAIEDGFSGSLSSGLHHAEWDHGKGFCTFNGLAIAATTALAEGFKRIGILDLDAHCGGGTFDILGHDPDVKLADVSVCAFDVWEPTDDERHHFKLVKDHREYLTEVSAALHSLEGIDFLIYNAGMDAHGHAGGLRGITNKTIRRREAMVARWASERGIPTVFVLAGGYAVSCTIEDVADLHVETVAEFFAVERALVARKSH